MKIVFLGSLVECMYFFEYRLNPYRVASVPKYLKYQLNTSTQQTDDQLFMINDSIINDKLNYENDQETL